MRTGDWIETYKGMKFYPLDPRPEDVTVEDIAHGLANTCRYSGQCKFFFSVAQHSLNCAAYIKRLGLGERWQLLALLHDAAEAYISDMPKPIKPFLPQFKDVEDNIMAMVYHALNIRPPNSIERGMVKQADLVMLATEARRLMLCDGWGDWFKDIEPDEETVICQAPIEEVEKVYLAELRRLLEVCAENMDDRRILTREEAIAMLPPDKERIHTFRAGGGAGGSGGAGGGAGGAGGSGGAKGILLGADWNKVDILTAIEKYEFELSGETMTGMGHGMAFKDEQGWCFVETREAGINRRRTRKRFYYSERV